MVSWQTSDTRQRRLTEIFALGISSLPTHVLVHSRPHTEEVGIALLDGEGRGNGQYCWQRQQPREAHRVFVQKVRRPSSAMISLNVGPGTARRKEMPSTCRC